MIVDILTRVIYGLVDDRCVYRSVYIRGVITIVSYVGIIVGWMVGNILPVLLLELSSILGIVPILNELPIIAVPDILSFLFAITPGSVATIIEIDPTLLLPQKVTNDSASYIS